MSLEIKIPAVGESITEVTIAQWLKKDGEEVAMDEVICELESEKATFELNAEADGVLKTLVNEGETIAVGTLIATIEPAKKSKQETNASQKQEASKSEISKKKSENKDDKSDMKA